GIQQRPIVRLPWILAVHPGDPLATRDSIGPADLATIRYIAYPETSASRQQLEQGFARLGITPRAPAGIADWDTATLLAELGIGHPLLPALPRPTAPTDTPARTPPTPALDPPPVGWAVRQWNALSPLAAEFAELVAAQP